MDFSTVMKISLILEWAYDKPSFDTKFLVSLVESYRKKGKFSQRQEEAVDNVYNKCNIAAFVETKMSKLHH